MRRFSFDCLLLAALLCTPNCGTKSASNTGGGGAQPATLADFAGAYDCAYSGGGKGRCSLQVSGDGSISAVVSLADGTTANGTGKLEPAGGTTFNVAGGGQSRGVTATFTGAFRRDGSGFVAWGTWKGTFATGESTGDWGAWRSDHTAAAGALDVDAVCKAQLTCNAQPLAECTAGLACTAHLVAAKSTACADYFRGLVSSLTANPQCTANGPPPGWLDAGCPDPSGCYSPPAPAAMPATKPGRAVQVFAGAMQNCALDDQGAAWCWGYNGAGQLGDGTYSSGHDVQKPVRPRLAEAVASLAGSEDHTCAVTKAGAVYCWGRNENGQLGTGAVGTMPAKTPTLVPGLTTGGSAVAAGYYHTCAAFSVGTVGVKCWGGSAGSAKVLGSDATQPSPSPIDVAGIESGVSAISSKYNHTCAVTAGGGVLCWGDNSFGQLGDGTQASKPTPVGVVGLSSGVTSVAAGSEHSCALTSAGSVLCWGASSATGYALPDGGTPTNQTTPRLVAGLESGVKAIAASGHTCAVLADGKVKCWGSNHRGPLGDGTETSRIQPVDVVGLGSGATSVATGLNHTCAALDNGRVQCWGVTDYASGTATFVFTTKPQYVPDFGE